ncbi:MAG: response regulator [Bacillota bacterium]
MEEGRPVILVVDDEINIRKTVARALGKEQYDVKTAVNGEEALTMIEEQVPDIILLDMKMPGMDGLEVLRQLRERKARSKVVIITAYGTVDNAVEAMKLGAVDFLQKPFLPDDIRDLVQDILRRPDPAQLMPDQDDYESLVEAARAALQVGDYQRAEEWLKQARAADDRRPGVQNLLGALYELRGDRKQAIKMYRVALSLEPGYGPGKRNLERITGWRADMGPIDLGRGADDEDDQQ